MAILRGSGMVFDRGSEEGGCNGIFVSSRWCLRGAVLAACGHVDAPNRNACGVLRRCLPPAAHPGSPDAASRSAAPNVTSAPASTPPSIRSSPATHHGHAKQFDRAPLQTVNGSWTLPFADWLGTDPARKSVCRPRAAHTNAVATVGNGLRMPSEHLAGIIATKRRTGGAVRCNDADE
jgi:hypothetical protein